MTIRPTTVALVIIFVLLLLPPSLGFVWMALSDTTVYAPGYSEQVFWTLRPGMSEGDVIRLMGKPLDDGSNEGYVNWYYGPPTLTVGADGAVSASGGWTYVRADGTGKIDGAAGNYLKDPWEELIGLNLAEMRKRYGDPVAIYRHPTWRYLAYTATRVSGSYFIRRVFLDATGHVIQIEGSWYQD